MGEHPQKDRWANKDQVHHHRTGVEDHLANSLSVFFARKGNRNGGIFN
jgi:hypothetical protein